MEFKSVLMSFSGLPDALLKDIARFLPPEDLCRFEMIDRRTNGLDTQDLWEQICKARWEQWPRYRLTPARLQWLEENLPTLNWKDRYVWAEEDATRTRITWEELEAMSWYFNFTPQAGGRGSETLQTCQFTQGFFVFEPISTYALSVGSDGWGAVSSNLSFSSSSHRSVTKCGVAHH
jgi:hypothetical protein